MCYIHDEVLVLTGNSIAFPVDKPSPSVDEKGWILLDQSDMTCPKVYVDEGCNSDWGWEVQGQ